jgi:lactam utilization protein B
MTLKNNSLRNKDHSCSSVFIDSKQVILVIVGAMETISRKIDQAMKWVSYHQAVYIDYIHDGRGTI